jgi:Uma2 family endonuclease
MNNLSVLEPLRTFPPSAVRDPEPFYEVIDGHRIEKPPMSYHAVKVASRLTRLLGNFADANRLGEVVGEALFHIPTADDLNRNRRSDVAFVSFARWPQDRPDDYEVNAWGVIPDLAVEVVSPHDVSDDQMQKVVEGLRLPLATIFGPGPPATPPAQGS